MQQADAIFHQKQQLMEQVCRHVAQRWPHPQAEELQGFIRHYYYRVPPEDLAERSVGDLYGAAVSHWNLARRRRSDTPRINVYNPEPEQHGWESSHTIIQIVVDDLPFLVDSVAMALGRHGLTVHLIIHPILQARREQRGELRQVSGGPGNGETLPEAWMHFEVDRQPDGPELEALRETILQVLGDCRTVVRDWQPMREQMRLARDELAAVSHADREEQEETLAFLDWLIQDHFTFLGYRRYDLQRSGRRLQLQPQGETALGILRNADTSHASHSFNALPAAIQALARDPAPLVLTKSTSRATVHRPGYMDYVGVKRFNAKGKVIGEHRFLGLYTSAAYNTNPRYIPLLRRKIRQVIEHSGLPHPSHDSKALVHILESYPRDELFQIDAERVDTIATGILHLQDRQRVRLFVRQDTYGRFVSCLVFAPRDRYDSDVRRRMLGILETAFGATQSEFTVNLSESALARIHFILHLDQADRASVDLAEVEARLAETVLDWSDDLHRALLDYYGEIRGNRLRAAYGSAFSTAYREDTQPRSAAHDVDRLERLNPDNPLEILLYRPLESDDDELRLRLFHRQQPITLSDALPLLENMGVSVQDERPYAVNAEGRAPAWIHDFGLRLENARELEIDQVRTLFEKCFSAAWHERVENDGFNRLVIAARLDWREITVLRAYCKYLRQAGTTLSQSYMEETLVDHPRITRLLVRLFHTRFDPERADLKRSGRIAEQLEAALNEVPSLDQDRILRRLLAAIQATLRTNHYQTEDGGDPKEHLSLKLNPTAIPEMPQPLPAYEIFVYSPRMEGVHLRGGKVARGGLRWSDRREDYRTEILGLMKAQMVKNAVIVPVGAKGGFVLKRQPEDRDALQAEVKRCYRSFIRGLLDITDNYPGGEVQAPDRVVCDDDADPYLVVAADKGTATFSDTANAIAAEYGFWLQDAFASGGSNGYDHKKMGITARGGWEAVKRHFRELGRNIQQEPFTVVGVGDMSGDVFGNGMLLSEQIRLVAAFDHRHIFIDPDPDPGTGFRERQRLFLLERSSWDDYDRSLISKGGGVYSRDAKSVTLSEETRRTLGIEAEQLTPSELIQAVLRAPVDLLWNGGIGTYVKASAETHLQVGDRANDTVRVDAATLRCRVVGEGGNLGVTQLGRIEYALAGGRINTDAIDNAGGVSCSDQEVNIKILLNEVVERGELTGRQRNRLLAGMTDEVARLVLEGNYRQTESLTLMQRHATGLLNEHARLIRLLEQQGRLKRRLERLPDDEQLAERAHAGEGLTRPESAVLLAHAKLAGFDALMETALADNDELEPVVTAYFPQPLRQRYGAEIRNHPLRREVICTQIINEMLNRMGAGFLFRMQDASGSGPDGVARAFLTARRIFDLPATWEAIDALDNQVSDTVQWELRDATLQVMEFTVLWLLHNFGPGFPVDSTGGRMEQQLSRLDRQLDELLPESWQGELEEQVGHWRQQGVPETLAGRVSRLRPLTGSLDVSRVAEATGEAVETALRVHFLLAHRLQIDWLTQAIDSMPALDAWHERCRLGLRDDALRQLRQLTASALTSSDAPTPEERVDHWLREHALPVDRLLQTLAALQSAGQPDVARLSVAVQDVKNLVVVSAAGTGTSGQAVSPT
ncbi:MAG: NAD-glutamate dehydrogenase [Ectothiorhodospiraceae bacterium]|nr:NAD-glutamate dehydrogenase [Ectothiorhodospiraceae bacterium]